MGFTTGFLGGLTLTYSVVYLSVYAHRQNRTYQSLLLRQQAQLLNSVIDPPEPEYAPPMYRVEQAGMEELLKDRWNREVENLVRKAQHTDWEALRIRWEGRLGSAWARVRGSEQAQEIEQRVREGAKDLKENVAAGAQEVKENVVSGAEKLKDNVIAQSEKARDNVIAQSQKAKDSIVGGSKETKENVKQKANEAIHGKRLLEL